MGALTGILNPVLSLFSFKINVKSQTYLAKPAWSACVPDSMNDHVFPFKADNFLLVNLISHAQYIICTYDIR